MVDFGKAIRNFLFRTIGLPDESDMTTRKALIQFDKATKFFLTSLRNGYEQNDGKLVLKIRLRNIFLRSAIIFTIIRTTVFLFVDNYYFDLFLANPFSRNKSTKSFLFLILMDLICIWLFTLREYCLHVEETGRFKVFRVFYQIAKNGLDPVKLGLSHRQCKKFHRKMHFLMIHGYRMILITSVLIFVASTALKVLNFSSYLTAVHLIFLVAHIPIECFSILTVSASGISFFINFGSYLALNLSRFNTLTEIIKKNSVVISSNSTAFRNMNNRVVYFLNHFDKIDTHWKYLLQYYFFMISLTADFGFFVAVILDFGSDIVTKILAFYSIVGHFSGMMGYYLFANFYHEVSSD